MPEPARIFLSYAHADGDAVGRIYQQLKDRDYKPWLDREDILGGEEWEPAIRTGIRESDLFLLCMSRHSLLRRGVLQKEVRIALDIAEEKLETDIFLIPVWIQLGDPLPKEEMPDRLSRLQWINLSETDGWPKLIRSIEHQSRRLGLGAPSPPRATSDAPAGGQDAGSADVEQLVAQVRTALQASDLIGVEEAAASIVKRLQHRGHGFTALDGRRVVSQLWSRHLVALVQHVSDAFLQAGVDAQPIRRFYTEALLEQGWLTATFDALSKLQEGALADPTEGALVGDLRGRAHTAAYLAAADDAPDDAADHLWRGVTAYHGVYTSDPRRNLLHGTRAAALVLRATRSGLQAAITVSPADIATRVLNEIRDSEELGRPLGLDDCEAALHAALVLERHDEALRRLEAYLSHVQIDVVNLRTLDRQLSGVWQLRHDSLPGSSLLPLVVARLKVAVRPWQELAAPGPPEQESAGLEPKLERIFSGSKFNSLSWYRRGLECVQSVARIETLAGSGIATGFLVSGRELHASLPDEPLLLTTSFVVTNEQAVREKYSFSVFGPDELRARFQSDDLVSSLEVVWTSFSAGSTILRLKTPVDGDRHLQIAPGPLQIGRLSERAFIIGHPSGGDLAFSLEDNEILDGDDRVLRYRTPTVAGSSGSPVFNDLWQVIAIHHAGGVDVPRLHGRPGTYAANEGIRIEFIRKTIESEAGAVA